MIGIKPMEEDKDYQALYNTFAASVKRLVFNHCYKCTANWENNYEMHVPTVEDYNDYATELGNLSRAEFCVSIRHLFPSEMPVHYGDEYQTRLADAMQHCQTVRNAFVAIEYWENDKLHVFYHVDGDVMPPGVEWIIHMIKENADVEEAFENE